MALPGGLNTDEEAEEESSQEAEEATQEVEKATQEVIDIPIDQKIAVLKQFIMKFLSCLSLSEIEIETLAH